MLIKIIDGLVYFFGTLLALDIIAIFSAFTILIWNNALGYENETMHKVTMAIITNFITIALPLGITLLFRTYLKDRSEE